MVIDADDNIEISPEAQEALSGATEDETAETEGSQGSRGVVGGGSASASGGAGGSSSSSSGAVAGGAESGATGGDVVEDEGTVLEDNEDSRKTPSFSLSEGSTSPVGFTANISIADEENMLSSGTTVTIVDRLTGKVVYESNVAAGVLDFDISAAGLDPDTEYVISATATYKDGDQEYTKSFLDKVFKTDPVGIHLNKAYSAADELSVNVSIGAYANVVNSRLRLVDAKGDVVETKDVDVTAARMDGGVDVVFENLSSNSDYTAELRDVTYSNVTVESFGDGLKLKTLRRAPKFPNPQSTTDRKARQFYLDLPKSDIDDPDAGITGYAWEVYKAADVDLKGTGEALIKGDPVWTGNPAAGTTVTVPIDELAIRTGETYVARALVSFDDNEKVITYDTAFTQTFSISGRKFPTIRLDDVDVTFERYQGKLSIDDAGAIVWDTTHPIKVVYRDSVGYESAVLTFGPEDASEGSIATGSVVIPLDLKNLRSNTEYTVQVFATYDLNDDAIDNSGEPVTGFIGSAKFTTPLPDTLAVNYENDTTSQSAFSVKVNLKAADAARDVDLEMSTMSTIRFTLFEGSRETGTEIASRTMTGGTSVDDPYESELKATLYQSAATITPSFFDLSDSSIKANTQYTLVVGPAEDYTSNPDPSGSGKNIANDLPIDQQTASYPITTANTWPELPDDLTSAVQVTPITNGQAESYGHKADDNLDAGTVVGFRVSSTFPNGNRVARKVTYYAIDDVTGSISQPAFTYSQEVGTNGEIPVWTVFFDETDGKLSRGHRYRFSYTMDISLTNDGTIITYPECAQKGVELTSKQQSAPYQRAEFSLYASARKNGKASWMYTAKDPDGVLDQMRESYEKAEFRYARGTSSSTSPLTLDGNCTKDWKTVEVPFTDGQTYTLFIKQNLYDYNLQADQQMTQLVRQYVDATRDWSMQGANAAFSDLTAKVDSGHGVLDIALTASNKLTATDMNAIAGLDLTFTTKSGSRTLKVAPLVTPGDSGGGTVEAEVKLKDIADLLGKDFTVSAKVIYDNGSFGLDEEVAPRTGFAFQQLVSDNGAAGDYVKVPSNASYSYTSSTSLSGGGNKLKGSMPVLSYADAFKGESGNAKDIVFTSLSGAGGDSKAKVRSSAQGLVLLDSSGASTGRSVVTKWLSTTSDELTSGKLNFDSIPPIVSKGVITPGIDRAEVSLSMELVGMEAKDNALELVLKKKVGNGWEDVDTYTYKDVSTNGSSPTKIVIPQGIEDNESLGLEAGATYQFELFAHVKKDGSTGNYTRTAVVDREAGTHIAYEFSLLDKVDVDLTSVQLVPDVTTPYSVKNIVVSYNLKQVLGFDTTVSIYAADEHGDPTGDVLLESLPTGVNTYQDSREFEFNPGGENAKKLPLGASYVAVVECRTKAHGDGESPTVIGRSERPFTLDQLDAPIFSISARPSISTTTEVRDAAQADVDSDSNVDPVSASASDSVATEVKHYGLTFKVSVFDREGSLVGGTYKVRFFKGDEQLETKFDDKVFSITDLNKQFDLSELEESTTYTMKIYGVLDQMNAGGKDAIDSIEPGEDTLIATSTGRTTPSSGVDVGSVQLTQNPEHPDQFTMNFYGSVNLPLVKRIQYTTYSSTEVVESKTVDFTPTLKTLNGSEYYVFDLGVSLPKAGYYQTQVTYIGDDGSTLATGTYVYVLNDDTTQEGA